MQSQRLKSRKSTLRRLSGARTTTVLEVWTKNLMHRRQQSLLLALMQLAVRLKSRRSSCHLHLALIPTRPSYAKTQPT